MATMEHFYREIAAGSAMHAAGNIDAAVRHCKAALDIAPDHIDAYELQVDILRAKDRPEEALRITQKRLERVPDCRWANIQQVRLLAAMQRSGLAGKARDQALDLFADDPMMVHDINLIFDICLDNNRAVLKRIKQLRRNGYWGIYNLDSLEQVAHANSGHVGKLGKLQQKDLQDGKVDAETLSSQATVRYLQGRLFTARRLASQAIDVDPANRPLYAETKFAAALGMIPLFWGAQVFITLVGSLTSRLPWFIRIFTNYAIALASLLLLGFLLLPISKIPGISQVVADAVIGTLGIANVAWALYVIWAFGSVGRWRARKRKIGLSKDY